MKQQLTQVPPTPLSLIQVTLSTLQRFLTWIPLGFIFQTSLIHTLLDTFFPVPSYRSNALLCLTEIATLTDLEPQYDTLFQSMFIKFMARMNEVFPPNTNLKDNWDNMKETEQVFIQRLALFLTGFLKVSREHERAKQKRANADTPIKVRLLAPRDPHPRFNYSPTKNTIKYPQGFAGPD